MRNTVCFLFLFLCTVAGYAQSSNNPVKYSQVKIFAPKQKIVRLQSLGVDFDHGEYNEEEQSLLTSVPASDIFKIRKLGYRVVVTIADEAGDFIKRNNPKDFYKFSKSATAANARFSFASPAAANATNYATPAAFTTGSMGGYYTLAEMVTKIDAMKTGHPALVRIDTIGYSYENRPILAVKISDNVDTDETEAEVLYTGLHHAREPMGMMNLIFFMQYLLENYNSNPFVQELVNSRELYFVPCVNPDGYYYNNINNPNGGGMHRKNRKPNGSTTNPGTDLNRNYGYGWGHDNTGSSPDINSDAYRGPAAFSEPETQAMKAYLNTRQFKLALNYHAYGNYWVHCPNVPGPVITPQDSAIIKTTGSIFTRYNTYLLGTPTETVGYSVNGTTEDWYMYGDQGVRGKIYSQSPEIGSNNGTAAASFYPVASNIIPLAKEVMFSNLQAAYVAGSFVKIEDNTNLAVTATSGSFSFVARRLGLTDAPATVSLIPVLNVASGGSVTIPGIANYRDAVNQSVNYTLSPGITAGQKLVFVWRTQTDGISIDDTVTKIYNPTVLVNESAEAITAWTSVGGWGTSTVFANSGTRSFSESPTGNYANNKTNTTTANSSTLTYKNAINLSGATAAYLSFWVRYKAENGRDKLRVQVASNRTSPTWVNMAGLHTVVENKGTLGSIPSFTGLQEYWVREVIDLKNFLGSSNAGLRFQFFSDAAKADDGFYIDDIQIVKTTAAQSTFRVVQFAGQLQNNVPTIQFETEADSTGSRYELQRSVNGIDFETIKTTKQSFLNFADNTAAAGSNYYRVKTLQNDGQVAFSKVVQLAVNGIKSITLMPNPVVNQLQISCTAAAAGRATVDVVDAQGRVLLSRQEQLAAGQNTLFVNVGKLKSQTYYLRITTAGNQVMSIEKFVKK